jgi:hypothetical protein
MMLATAMFVHPDRAGPWADWHQAIGVRGPTRTPCGVGGQVLDGRFQGVVMVTTSPERSPGFGIRR